MRKRLLSLALFILACFALPQQAVAQNTYTDILGTTFTLADAVAVDEGSTARFTLNLSQPDIFGVGFRLGYANGSANIASDLGSGRPTFVNLNTTGLSFNIDVPIHNDNLEEGEETFTLRILNSTGEILLSATGTINPSDIEATVSIASTATAAEGSTITFAVNLSTAVAEAVTARWTATATGTNPATLSGASSDLTSTQVTTGTVVFAANTTTAQSISIATVNDTLVEGSETFTVTLSEDTQGGNSLPVGVTIPAGTAAGIATITDVVPTVSISSTATAAEGSTITFAVNLSAAVTEAVTVRWTATSTADNEVTPIGNPGANLSGPTSDLASGQVTTGTVMFSANTTTAQSISLATANDTRVEGSESFTVTLSEDIQGGNPLPMGVSIPSATEAGTATITEDDTATVSIASTATAEEGSDVIFVVNLSAEVVRREVTVAWTATATGTGAAMLSGATSDLGSRQALTGSVRFSANTGTTQRITLATADDTRVEGAETFTVTLSEHEFIVLPMEVTLPGATAAGTATITDNDVATVSITPTVTAEEGSAVVFAVNLSAAVTEAVTDAVVVRWTATATGSGAATLEGATSDLGSGQVLAGTVMFSPDTTMTQSISLTTVDDTLLEENETFTVTLSPDSDNPLPTSVIIPSATEAGTGTITDNDTSALIESRLVGAATALRRHVKRFDSMTGTVIRNRLEGHKTNTLTASRDLKDGAMALGSESAERRMGAWLNGAYARFNGDATGRQADIYGGIDYLSDNNNWLIGALIGYEPVDLDIGEAAYEANYTHFGLYGGMRVSKRLVLDGAISYGTATPDIALGNVSASYDADRFTVRGGLTGDLGIEYALGAGSITIEPQLGILYSRESLDGFMDSADKSARSQNLELGRLSAGPRLTWNVNGNQLIGSARIQWDFSDLDDGVDEEVSAAADIGLRLALAPHVDLGLYGEIDGIGITDEFITYGGRVELNARF